MKRVNELKKMTENVTNKVNTITASETVINNRDYKNYDGQNKDNTLKNEIAEEKAARIFPLNILSNKFKLKDSSTHKGMYIFSINICMYVYLY